MTIRFSLITNTQLKAEPLKVRLQWARFYAKLKENKRKTAAFLIQTFRQRANLTARQTREYVKSH